MPKPPSATVTCKLCSATGPALEMAVFASPTLSVYSDPALSWDYYCPPCFDRARNSKHLRARVYQRHDRIERQALEALDAVTDAELEAMQDLPEGLRVSAEETARFREIRESTRLIQSKDRRERRTYEVLHDTDDAKLEAKGFSSEEKANLQRLRSATPMLSKVRDEQEAAALFRILRNKLRAPFRTEDGSLLDYDSLKEGLVKLERK